MRTHLHTSLLVFGIMFFLTGCGQQTVTESLLSADQSLDQAIELLATHQGDNYSSVMIETTDPLLPLQTNITRYAGRSLSGLPEKVSAQKLLSPYAENTAHTYSKFSGPNCWHTAIASLFKEWTERRHMASEEFSCVLRNYFVEVQTPHFGDVIRFRNVDGEEIHGATFLGVDQETREAVVYTKNGYLKSEPWEFMNLKDLKNVYAEAKSVRFFTPTRKAIEARDVQDLCNSEYRESRREQESINNIEKREIKASMMHTPF